MRQLSFQREVWPIRGTFRISRGTKTTAEVLVAQVTQDGVTGRGECVPYRRYGETFEKVEKQISEAQKAIEGGADRHALLELMIAGAARNAVDCALWDLEAKLAGKPVHELAGLPAPGPVTTAFTVTLDDPEKMAEVAAREAHRPLLKLKLGNPDGDVVRARAVREAAPDSILVVDANEGWKPDQLNDLFAAFAQLDVRMIEQPLRAGDDAALGTVSRAVPICADESCHATDSLDALRGRYDIVNIKLDKTGGLTEALRLRDAARAQGFQVMVGCMVATSLAMAPALLVAQGADFVDVDGPLMLKQDREPGLTFDGSTVSPATADLWG
ncbi:MULTISPECIES: N-acetyl-D-Glu racemase DgcA [unclassified Minwuia]|uniref:N-acetyl-D-Glu racemase DgcA n=1 Tax=unclassified Minwuia TaxID=2618799 RepID=UPI00247ACE72|nr:MULTISPECIES: N-acetyl-D-Glu racemase DgcA [unclassified Minwuia]